MFCRSALVKWFPAKNVYIKSCKCNFFLMDEQIQMESHTVAAYHKDVYEKG